MAMQFTRQFKTFSSDPRLNVATSINNVLAACAECRVVDIHTIYVQKIGGTDTEVIVVFECGRDDTAMARMARISK